MLHTNIPHMVYFLQYRLGGAVTDALTAKSYLFDGQRAIR